MNRRELERAYRATAYRVELPDGGRLVLRCDGKSPELDRLLAAAGVAPWAFITACNPRSRPLAAEDNRARMDRLEAAVRQGGWAWHPGTGEADRGDWPPEPSLLVLGIREAEAVSLAREFGQHAILAGAVGEAARLVWVGSAAD